MEKTIIQTFCNKNLRVALFGGFHYSGQIISIGETSFVFLDKFGNNIAIDFTAVSHIQECAEGGRA